MRFTNQRRRARKLLELASVDTRPSYLDPQHRREVEAYEFAAELLMSTGWLKRDVAELGANGEMLAKWYGVSELAMWIP